MTTEIVATLAKGFSLMLIFFSSICFADGRVNTIVYHPYVQPLEREFELQVNYQNGSASKAHSSGFYYSLGYGQAITDRLSAELSIGLMDINASELDVSSIEAELKWQMTEQGEYDADWGLVVELERELDGDATEVGAILIGRRQWSRWLATGNIGAAYEWGGGINNELETSFSGQLRYRAGPAAEPAIEVYVYEDDKLAGPVLTGIQRLGVGEKFYWEAGILLPLTTDSSNLNLKLNFEYEFL